MKQILMLQNGMTAESLIFVIDKILSGAVEQIQNNMPDNIGISERQSMTLDGKSTTLSSWEGGVIAQAIGSIAIIVAQSIDDGIGDGDVDDLLGDFSQACRKFVESNWKGYGRPCMERYDELSADGSFSFKELYLNFPDTLSMAKKLVTDLHIVES